MLIQANTVREARRLIKFWEAYFLPEPSYGDSKLVRTYRDVLAGGLAAAQSTDTPQDQEFLKAYVELEKRFGRIRKYEEHEEKRPASWRATA